MKRTPLIFGILLLLTALTASCIFIKTRPWDNSSQRARFMLNMASNLLAPIPDNCIDDAHQRLKAKGLARPGDVHQAKLLLTQAGNGCEKALTSCGHCHLPAPGSGLYEIRHGEGKATRGRVLGLKDGNLIIAAGESDSQSIPALSVNTSVPLAGVSPWWDFKSFGRRGKQAKRMLLISAAHGVACENCHVRHGEFALTGEGRHYQRTRKVIKRVLLKEANQEKRNQTKRNKAAY